MEYESIKPTSDGIDPRGSSGLISKSGHDRRVSDLIDVLVGNRIRTRRQLLGMDRDTLGKALGLTFRQLQNYEDGATRVGASRLSAMAEILGVPILYFFGDLQAHNAEDTA